MVSLGQPPGLGQAHCSVTTTQGIDHINGQQDCPGRMFYERVPKGSVSKRINNVCAVPYLKVVIRGDSLCGHVQGG